MTSPTDQSIVPAGSALEQLQQLGGGLSQFDGSEGGVPRIRIKGKDTVYEDSASGMEVDKFTGIILGVARGRVLWPAEMSEDGDDPMCKSKNFAQGRPDLKTFPFGVTTSKGTVFGQDAVDEAGEVSCSACPLQKFETHPKRPKKPWCSEQTTVIVMADLDGSGAFVPSLLTVQSSGLQPTHRFLGIYQKKGIQPFSFYTELGLEGRKYAGNAYAVPTFKRLGETPLDEWEVYASNYLSLFQMLTTWREERDDDAEPIVADRETIPDF